MRVNHILEAIGNTPLVKFGRDQGMWKILPQAYG